MSYLVFIYLSYYTTFSVYWSAWRVTNLTSAAPTPSCTTLAENSCPGVTTGSTYEGTSAPFPETKDL